ncbi:DUF2333 family protein [Desulfococcaceae bacterium HSG7]|nr:DUF2333 family protein [Desulfococcaceae bacterium HSG7]
MEFFSFDKINLKKYLPRISFKKGATLYTLIAVGMLFVFIVFVMITNYKFPKYFQLETENKKPGEVFAQTLVTIADEMAHRWLPNDFILYPTTLLDNPQNFQLGELEALRYATRVLRDKLSRLRTTDKLDKDCEAVFVLFSNDPLKWWLPSAEGKYKSGLRHLEKYRNRLVNDNAKFYPRADNLIELLDQFCSLLGGVNTRLSHAPVEDKVTLSEETAGDEFTDGEEFVDIHIAWWQIDNNFYYARGVAYVIKQALEAVEHDFDNVLKIKKADELMRKTIHLLEKAQLEPLIIMNGDRNGIFANHSLILQSVLEDSRQKMRSIQTMLQN